MNDELLIVLTTFGSEVDAAKAARELVEAGLAACAQIETRPITSIYRWKGEVHEDAEVLLRLKTVRSVQDPLIDRLRALHSYDVPQIVWFGARTIEPYAAWAREQCDFDPDRSDRSS